jgi:hypothetical protein
MKIPSRNTLGIMALATGVPALCLLILPYYLFPEFYVAKTSGIGYTSPATIEGWVLMVTGLGLLAVTIACVMLRKSNQGT